MKVNNTRGVGVYDNMQYKISIWY